MSDDDDIKDCERLIGERGGLGDNDLDILLVSPCFVALGVTAFSLRSRGDTTGEDPGDCEREDRGDTTEEDPGDGESEGEEGGDFESCKES